MLFYLLTCTLHSNLALQDSFKILILFLSDTFLTAVKERIGIPPLLYIKENPFLEIRALFMLKFLSLAEPSIISPIQITRFLPLCGLFPFSENCQQFISALVIIFVSERKGDIWEDFDNWVMYIKLYTLLSIPCEKI